MGLGTLRWLDSRTSLYSSLPCHPEAEQAVFDSLAAHLQTLPGLRKLQADLVPKRSALARFFESLHAKAVATSPAFRLELSSIAAASRLSPSRRKELARCRRRLTEQGTVTHQMVTDADTQSEIVTWILKQKREKLATKNSSNHWLFRQETESYYRSMVSALAGDGGTLCTSFTVDNRRIAAGLYFVHGGIAFFSKMAFDPVFGKWSPGWLDFLAASEKLAALGIKQVDMMVGQGFLKETMATDRHDVVTYRRRFNPVKTLWAIYRR